MVASREVPETERQWLRVLGTANELQARLFVAQKALEKGREGISWLSRLSRMSRPTIIKGIAQLRGNAAVGTGETGRVRRPGRDANAWRKRILRFRGTLCGSSRRRLPETR